MTTTTQARVPLPHRAAAVVLVAVGLGFGIPVPIAVDHLQRTGTLPLTPFGFRAYSGPFESLGPTAFSVLAWALAAICAVDVVAGVLTWRGDPRGPRLAAIATPPGLVLGLGFALPIYLAAIPIRTALLLAGRQRR
jgi:hypothetical protein